MELEDTEIQVALDDTVAATAMLAHSTALESDEPPRQANIERSLAAESQNALAHQERQRTRRVAPLMACLGIFGASTLPFFGGTLWAKRLLLGSLVVGVLSMIWLWWLASRERVVEGWRAELPWTTAFLCTCSCTVYFGIYSPAPSIMIMAVVLYSMGRSRLFALLLCLLASATEVGIAVLDFSGVMSDPGLVTASQLSELERVLGLTLVLSLLATGFFVGRLARRATMDSIDTMQDVLRELARREVIAQEAREKVRRALNIGGAGRHSGATFGRYKLAELIGQGGMGEVYRASHEDTGEFVAVKVIHSHLIQDQEYLGRFLREAKLSSSVNSPHIVAVLDTGETGGEPYIAMELLSGFDLSAHLLSTGAQGTMPLDHLECLAQQIGAGLDAAAAAGIVHRDIKPQNIFLSGGVRSDSPPLQCKILDFGVARAADGGATITKASSALGTPAYMAPEQARGMVADHRADLHALTALLYRGATGLPPFSGDNAMSVMRSVIEDTPRPVSRLGLPASLDPFFQKGFAKDPELRFQSGRELSVAFSDACLRAKPDAA